MKRNKVAIAGGFDPLHVGHIDHINKASKLGDLVVIVASDEQLIRKKGYVFMPLAERIAIVASIRGVSEVVPNIDYDGCAKTLRMLKPNVFAKGGDRTPDNMPEPEIKACEEMGCKIIYNVGDLLNSSSGLVAKSKIKLTEGRDGDIGERYGC